MTSLYLGRVKWLNLKKPNITVVFKLMKIVRLRTAIPTKYITRQLRILVYLTNATGEWSTPYF